MLLLGICKYIHHIHGKSRALSTKIKVYMYILKMCVKLIHL